MISFLFNRSQSNASAFNQMSLLFFFGVQKFFFCSFQLFENGHFYNAVSRLINVVKLDVENSNIDSTLSNVVNINVDKQNIFSTLI